MRARAIEQLRQCRLVVEQHPLLVAAADHMQRESQGGQPGLGTCQTAGLVGFEQAQFHQCRPARHTETALGDPARGLQIAQGAATVLEIGLQIVGGIGVAAVALVAFINLGP